LADKDNGEGPQRFLGLEEVDWQYAATHVLINAPIAFAIVLAASVLAARLHS
jgi:hypothetical protein